jgi:hypothetical protein
MATTVAIPAIFQKRLMYTSLSLGGTLPRGFDDAMIAQSCGDLVERVWKLCEKREIEGLTEGAI